MLNTSADLPTINLFSNGDISVLNSILNEQFNISYLDF